MSARLNIVLPSEEQLLRADARPFANEVQLQRFTEDRVLPTWGFDLVASSERPGQRLGMLDTLAISGEGTPVILEYKHDAVDASALDQLRQYREWLANHREACERAVIAKFAGRSVDWSSALYVAIGYRFRLEHPSASLEEAEIVLLQYGDRPDNNLWMKLVARGRVGDHPHPKVSKDEALWGHLEKTTVAAQEAFKELRKRLRASELSLDEKIHGKNRVRYWHNRVLLLELTFTDVAIQCFFKGEQIHDPHGRTRTSPKASWRWTCGLASTADVEVVYSLIRQAAANRKDQ